jgi:hypothetical protein
VYCVHVHVKVGCDSDIKSTTDVLALSPLLAGGGCLTTSRVLHGPQASLSFSAQSGGASYSGLFCYCIYLTHHMHFCPAKLKGKIYIYIYCVQAPHTDI